MIDSTSPRSAGPWRSAVLLVVINSIPMWFLLYGGWSPGDVLVAYWLENVVVGAITILKISTARQPVRAGRGITVTTRRDGRTSRTTRTTRTSRAAFAGFFAMHFGLFTLVHGVFTGLLAFSIGVSGSVLQWASLCAGLMISHATSYAVHWIGDGERERTSPDAAMLAPYGRIVVLHVVVLASFFLVFRGFSDAGSRENDLAPALLLVGLKTVVDLLSHVRAHRIRASDAPAASQRGWR